jgi:hypothetical protein
MNTIDPRDLAVEYLLATRRGADEALALERQLAQLDRSELPRALDDDAPRLSFWLDVYNGAVQRHEVRTDGSSWDRLQHFRHPAVVVAGRQLSLDAIEHGILRRSRWRLSLGYVSNPVPGHFERTHRVDHVDPRIHFALNCGVASCPPIAAYQTGLIDEQLDRATRGYLATEIDRDGSAIVLSALLLWYIGDFGGPPGLRRFLADHDVEGWNRPIRFKSYDWTPAPDQWVGDDDHSS